MASKNSIMVITPYWYQGTWVFDDDRVGLMREPFVAGIPEMISLLVGHIPDARQGFRLTFSAGPFPGYQNRFDWVREEMGGNYYRMEGSEMEGWLCPALFHYFEEAPKSLYARADAKDDLFKTRQGRRGGRFWIWHGWRRCEQAIAAG